MDRPAGRWSGDEGKFYPASIAKIEASLNAAQESVQAMRGGGIYSGEPITIAARGHDQRMGAHARRRQSRRAPLGSSPGLLATACSTPPQDLSPTQRPVIGRSDAQPICEATFPQHALCGRLCEVARLPERRGPRTLLTFLKGGHLRSQNRLGD